MGHTIWNFEMVAILDAILNFSKCSMTAGHHSDSSLTTYSLTE